MFGDHIHAIGRHAAAIVTVRAPQSVIPTAVGMRAGGSIRDRFAARVLSQVGDDSRGERPRVRMRCADCYGAQTVK